MARRKLSIEDQLKGVRAAIKSQHCPPQLREGLKRRAEDLEKKLQSNGELPRTTKNRRGPLDFLLG